MIEQEAMRLPPAERALLADHLLQTLGCEDDCAMAEWGMEAERRLSLFLSGKMEAVDGNTFVASLRKSLT